MANESFVAIPQDLMDKAIELLKEHKYSISPVHGDSIENKEVTKLLADIKTVYTGRKV